MKYWFFDIKKLINEKEKRCCYGEVFDEFNEAKEILINALKAPFIQICENAGKSYKDVLSNVKDNLWYDALNDSIVNMENAGIIDPASVEKSAIMSAISISGIFLTTECAITDIPEPKTPAAPAADPSMMY